MTPEERLNQAESTAKKALEEVAEARRMLVGPWVPKNNERYFYVYHTGIEWKTDWTCRAPSLIASGNYFQTREEAQEVATQRNFMTEYISAGDLETTDYGFVLWIDPLGKFERRQAKAGETARKFSTREKIDAFIEKWGGESEVVARLQKGWV
jgi:hypothetical protein